jgi:hypothetical protein
VAVPAIKKPTGADLTPILAVLDQVRGVVHEIHTDMSMVNCNLRPLRQNVKMRWQRDLEQTDEHVQRAMAAVLELNKHGGE